MAKRLRTSSLADFSAKLVRFQRLPHGTEVRFYRKWDGRRVRSDFTLKRKFIKSTTVRKLDDGKNVRDLLDFAHSRLSTDIQARGFEMVLFGPDGERINGNTLLRTVRSMAAKPTDGDGEKAIELFIALLENAGLEEVTMWQAGTLYRELRDLLKGALDQALLTNELQIQARNL